MSTTTLTVSSDPSAADLQRIARSLTEFNEADVGATERVPIAVLVHDAAGELVAGISGYTGWGWLYVQCLWVAESQRGQGLAARMLAAAEDEARSRGCTGAYIDTFNPVALKTYKRAGYEPFGELEKFFMGRTRTFLQKAL